MNNQYNPYMQPYSNPYNLNQYQRPQENLNWIFVSDIPKVEQVSVQAGQKAWVMVQNEPVFALRVADNMGLITTDYYKFEKYNPQESRVETTQYVTKEEMNLAIENALKEIKKNEPVNE